MRKGLFCLLWLLAAGGFAQAQTRDELAIRDLLAQQTQTWNAGDLEGFMKSYWQSDSLLFIGKNGISWGWKAALENYRRGYPDTAAMGKLAFDILVVKRLSENYYYVVGRWYLHRVPGDLSGHYDLLLRRVSGRWVIVADHSS
ncbi:MAG TPA: DUF4440 domain-containing protein [Chitinophagaceae bacterium]|nr:DUF4440 domain-containing protein [Chitinophagaceae bacterium]